MLSKGLYDVGMSGESLQDPELIESQMLVLLVVIDLDGYFNLIRNFF